MDGLARDLVRLLSEKNSELNDPLIGHAVDFVLSKTFESSTYSAITSMYPQEGLRKIADSIVEYCMEYAGMDAERLRGTDGSRPWFFPDMEADIQYLVLNFIRDTENNPLLKLAVCKEQMMDFLALDEVLEAHAPIFERFFRITEELVRNGCPESTDALSIIVKDRSFAQIMKFLKELFELEQDFRANNKQGGRRHRPGSLLTGARRKPKKPVKNERKKNREARQRESEEQWRKANATTAAEPEKNKGYTYSNPIYDFFNRVTLRDLAITVIQVLEIASQLGPKPNPKVDMWSHVIVSGAKGNTTYNFKKRKYHLSARPEPDPLPSLWEESYGPVLRQGETAELYYPNWSERYPGEGFYDQETETPRSPGEASSRQGRNALYTAGSIGTVGLHLALRPSHPRETAALLALLAMGDIPTAEGFDLFGDFDLSATTQYMYNRVANATTTELVVGGVITGGVAVAATFAAPFVGAAAATTTGIINSYSAVTLGLNVGQVVVTSAATFGGVAGTYLFANRINEIAVSEKEKRTLILLDELTRLFSNISSVKDLSEAVKQDLRGGPTNYMLSKEGLFEVEQLVSDLHTQAKFLAGGPVVPPQTTWSEKKQYWGDVQNSFRNLTESRSNFVITLICPQDNNRCIAANIMSKYVTVEWDWGNFLKADKQAEIRKTLEAIRSKVIEVNPMWTLLNKAQEDKAATQKWIDELVHTPFTQSVENFAGNQKEKTEISVLELKAKIPEAWDNFQNPLQNTPSQVFKPLQHIITETKIPNEYFTKKINTGLQSFNPSNYVVLEEVAKTISGWIADADFFQPQVINNHTLATLDNWATPHFNKAPALRDAFFKPQSKFAKARSILATAHEVCEILGTANVTVTETFSLTNATFYLQQGMWGKEVKDRKGNFTHPVHFETEEHAEFFNQTLWRNFYVNVTGNSTQVNSFSANFTRTKKQFEEFKLMLITATNLTPEQRTRLSRLTERNVTVLAFDDALDKLSKMHNITEFITSLEKTLNETWNQEGRFSEASIGTIDDLELLWNMTVAQNLIASNKQNYPFLNGVRETGNDTLKNCKRLNKEPTYIGFKSISEILDKAKGSTLRCDGIFGKYIAAHEQNILKHLSDAAITKLKDYVYDGVTELEPKTGLLGETEFLRYFKDKRKFNGDQKNLDTFMDSKIKNSDVCTKEIRGLRKWLVSYTEHLFTDLPKFDDYIKRKNDIVVSLSPEMGIVTFMWKHQKLAHKGLETEDLEYVLVQKHNKFTNCLRKVTLKQQTDEMYDFLLESTFTSSDAIAVRQILKDRLEQEQKMFNALDEKNRAAFNVLVPPIIENTNFELVGEDLGKRIFEICGQHDYRKMAYPQLLNAERTVTRLEKGVKDFYQGWLNEPVPAAVLQSSATIPIAKDSLEKMKQNLKTAEPDLFNHRFAQWKLEKGEGFFNNVTEYKVGILGRTLNLLQETFKNKLEKYTEVTKENILSFNWQQKYTDGDWESFLDKKPAYDVFVIYINECLQSVHNGLVENLFEKVDYYNKAETIKSLLNNVQIYKEIAFQVLTEKIKFPEEFLPEPPEVAKSSFLKPPLVYGERDFLGEYVADLRGIIKASEFIEPDATTIFLPRYRKRGFKAPEDLTSWTEKLTPGNGFLAVNGSRIIIYHGNDRNQDIVLDYAKQSTKIYPTRERFIDAVVGIVEKGAQESRFLFNNAGKTNTPSNRRFQGYKMIELGANETTYLWNTASIENILWVEIAVNAGNYTPPEVAYLNNYRALLHENHGVWWHETVNPKSIAEQVNNPVAKIAGIILAENRVKFKNASLLDTLQDKTYVDMITSSALFASKYEALIDYDKNAIVSVIASSTATLITQGRMQNLTEADIINQINRKTIELKEKLTVGMKNENRRESRVEKSYRLLKIVDEVFRGNNADDMGPYTSASFFLLVLTLVTGVLKIFAEQRNLRRRKILLTREVEFQTRIRESQGVIGILGAHGRNWMSYTRERWDTALMGMISGLTPIGTAYGLQVNPYLLAARSISSMTIPYTLQTFTSHTAMALRLTKYTEIWARGVSKVVKGRSDDNSVRIITQDLPDYFFPANTTEIFVTHLDLFGDPNHSEAFKLAALLSIRFALAEFCDDLKYYTWLMELPLIPGALIPKHGFRQIDPTNFIITVLNYMNPDLKNQRLRDHCTKFVERLDENGGARDKYSLFLRALFSVCKSSNTAAELTGIYADTTLKRDPQLFTKILIRVISEETGAFRTTTNLETFKGAMEEAIKGDEEGFKDKIAMTRILSTFFKLAHKQTVENMRIIVQKTGIQRQTSTPGWAQFSEYLPSTGTERTIDTTDNRMELEALTYRNLLTVKGEALEFWRYCEINTNMPAAPQGSSQDLYSFCGGLKEKTPEVILNKKKIVYLSCISTSIGMSILYYWNKATPEIIQEGIRIMQLIEDRKYEVGNNTPPDQYSFRKWLNDIEKVEKKMEMDFWNFKLPWIHLHTYGTLGLHILSELQDWKDSDEFERAKNTIFVRNGREAGEDDMVQALHRTMASLKRMGTDPSYLKREEHVLKCRPSQSDDRTPGIRLRKWYASLQIMKNICSAPNGHQGGKNFWTKWGIYVESSTRIPSPMPRLVENLASAVNELKTKQSN